MFSFGSRHMRGEREAGHIGTREVGNVDPETEITFQFGAIEQDVGGERGKSVTIHRWISLAYMTLSLNLHPCLPG